MRLRLLTRKDPASLGVMTTQLCPRHGSGGDAAVRWSPAGFWTHDRRRLLLRFRPGTHAHRRRFPRHRSRDAANHQLGEPFERSEEPRDKALQDLPRPAAGSTRSSISRRVWPRRERCRSTDRANSSTSAAGRTFPRPRAIGAFKLLSVAGAYWKGDASRKQLQRLYGTAFFHKRIWKNICRRSKRPNAETTVCWANSWSCSASIPLVGSGLVMWLPKGAIDPQPAGELRARRTRLAEAISRSIRRTLAESSCTRPPATIPYYSDSMFTPIVIEQDEQYILKPMNCPHHVMIYKSKPRSYRDLPVRLAEFGTVYRYEKSGELSGMTRVRGFTQDDAHIFCTEEQVADEFRGCIEMTQFVLQCAGTERIPRAAGLPRPGQRQVRGRHREAGSGPGGLWSRSARSLGLDAEPGTWARPPSTVPRPILWSPTASAANGSWAPCSWTTTCRATSASTWNTSVADNHPHRPVMIHRAPLGSMERFMGVLIEHFAGAFPLWLAPEQVRVLTVSEKSEEYGRQVEEQLRAAGLRVSGDYRAEKLGAKIRDAQLELIPYMLVVGPRDAQQGTVSLRDRIEGDLGALPIDQAIDRLQDEVQARTVRQTFSGTAGLGERGTANQY